MGWRQLLEVDRNRDPDCKLVPGRRTRDSMGGGRGPFGRLNTHNTTTTRHHGRKANACTGVDTPGQTRPAYSVNTHLLCRAASRPPCLKRCLRARIISATRNRNRTNVNGQPHNFTKAFAFGARWRKGGLTTLHWAMDDPLCKGLPSPAPAFLQSHRHDEFGTWEPGSLGVLRSWSWKLGSW